MPPKSVLKHVAKLTELAPCRPPELSEDISRRNMLDRLELHAQDGIESVADVLDIVQRLLQHFKYLDALLLSRVPAPQEDLGPSPGCSYPPFLVVMKRLPVSDISLVTAVVAPFSPDVGNVVAQSIRAVSRGWDAAQYIACDLVRSFWGLQRSQGSFARFRRTRGPLERF